MIEMMPKSTRHIKELTILLTLEQDYTGENLTVIETRNYTSKESLFCRLTPARVREDMLGSSMCAVKGYRARSRQQN